MKADMLHIKRYVYDVKVYQLLATPIKSKHIEIFAFTWIYISFFFALMPVELTPVRYI